MLCCRPPGQPRLLYRRRHRHPALHPLQNPPQLVSADDADAAAAGAAASLPVPSPAQPCCCCFRCPRCRRTSRQWRPNPPRHLLCSGHPASTLHQPTHPISLCLSLGLCASCSNRLGIRMEGPRPQFARTDGGEGGSHPSNVHDHVYALGEGACACTGASRGACALGLARSRPRPPPAVPPKGPVVRVRAKWAHSREALGRAPSVPLTSPLFAPAPFFSASAGTINFTGDMPVVLMVDGPSLGGFVCPATITTTELWKMGQVRPGDAVRFRKLSIEEVGRGRGGGGVGEPWRWRRRCCCFALGAASLPAPLLAPLRPAATRRPSVCPSACSACCAGVHPALHRGPAGVAGAPGGERRADRCRR